MSTFSSKFNKPTFNVDTKDFIFTNLSDLLQAHKPNEVYKVDGIFITTGKFGDSPVFINSQTKSLVNIPGHLTKTANEILRDSEAIEAINRGEVGFTIYEYTNSLNKLCYSIKFVDL